MALVGGAVAGVLVAATSGDGNQPSGNPFVSNSGTVLVAGNPSLGPPR